MNKINVLFKKDLQTIFRDRGTAILLFLFPIFIPLLILGIAYLELNFIEGEGEKEFHLALIGDEQSSELYYLFRSDTQVILHHNIAKEAIQTHIDQGDIDVAVVIEDGFKENIQNMQAANIYVYFRTQQTVQFPVQHVKAILTSFAKAKMSQRLDQLKIHENVFTPIHIKENDFASHQERSSQVTGLLLPLAFIFICWIAIMSIATEIGVGEKERGTLETLMATPVQKQDIFISKFLIIFLSGLWMAIMTLCSISLLGFLLYDMIPQAVMQMIEPLLQVSAILQIVLLIIPTSGLLAVLALSLSFWAKSIAQAGLLSGLVSVLIFPMIFMIAMLSVKLNTLTAFIPMANIIFACKEVAAGTMQPLFILEIYLSSCLIIWAIIHLCRIFMLQEKHLFSN
ncbi:MAG: ABC transporter permease [Mariprofundaceae bacterium]|nr:ABC transporter permease [Mariprofundaceae bacterium]